MSIAASGMMAATQRLQTAASNVANEDSDGPSSTASAAIQAQYPPAYAAQQVDQVATSDGGTSTSVSTVQPGTVATYDPTAPYADQNGEVASPNVDAANQAIQAATANYTYDMNAQVVRVYSQMMQMLLDVVV